MFKDINYHLNNSCYGIADCISIGNRFLSKNSTLLGAICDGLWWQPRKITTASGAVFFTVGRVKKGTVYFWLYFMGSPQEALNFSWTCSIDCKVPAGSLITKDAVEKCSFTGPVHTLDMGENDIIASGSLFM